MTKHLLAVLALLLLLATRLAAGEAEEDRYIAILRSDRGANEKAWACRKLKLVGTVKAVPALAACLTDKETAHSARYALETLPCPEAAAALRDAVAKATDGHTIGLMINGNMTIAKMINPAVRYDPLKDFAPISLVGVAPLVLVAPASAAGGDAKSFFDAARAAGNRWSYGSPGVGTVGHLGMELLKARTGIAPVHVPYPGYAQVFSGLVRGELQLSMLPPALAQTQIAAGKLRGIGVTSSGRSPLMPGLPSLADAGVKNFNLEIWNAVVAPASMPAAHVAKLAEVLGAIVRTPEMRAQLFQQGWQAVGSSPEGLARRIKADTTSLGTIIRAQNIRVQ